MITRQEYMSHSTKLHQAYYLEIALEAGLKIPAVAIKRTREELAAGNDNLNDMRDINLDAWTGLGAARKPELQRAMKKRGDFYSQAGACCAAKALAIHLAGFVGELAEVMHPAKAAIEAYTLDQIIEAADSLFNPPEQGHPEYARGVCELIGRLRLDHGGHGEETAHNAIEIAKLLNITVYSGWGGR